MFSFIAYLVVIVSMLIGPILPPGSWRQSARDPIYMGGILCANLRQPIYDVIFKQDVKFYQFRYVRDCIKITTNDQIVNINGKFTVAQTSNNNPESWENKTQLFAPRGAWQKDTFPGTVEFFPDSVMCAMFKNNLHNPTKCARSKMEGDTCHHTYTERCFSYRSSDYLVVEPNTATVRKLDFEGYFLFTQGTAKY